MPRPEKSYRIKSLVSSSPPHTENLLQCSARSGKDNEYWSGRAVQCEKTGLDPAYCLKGASIAINGKPYCYLHAGALAINILLGKKKEKVKARNKVSNPISCRLTSARRLPARE